MGKWGGQVEHTVFCILERAVCQCKRVVLGGRKGSNLYCCPRVPRIKAAAAQLSKNQPPVADSAKRPTKVAEPGATSHRRYCATDGWLVGWLVAQWLILGAPRPFIERHKDVASSSATASENQYDSLTGKACCRRLLSKSSGPEQHPLLLPVQSGLCCWTATAAATTTPCYGQWSSAAP